MVIRDSGEKLSVITATPSEKCSVRHVIKLKAVRCIAPDVHLLAFRGAIWS